MCAPLNTYIIKTKKRPFLSIVLALIALLVSSSVTAQDKLDIIKPTKKTHLMKMQHDVFVYASGSFEECLSFIIPNTGLYSMGAYPISTCISLGLCDFINFSDLVGANLSVGYMHERIANKISLWGNNGVYANWLNADISCSLSLYIFSCSAGLSADVFLGSRLVNNDNFSFESLNKNCFNTFALSSYFAFFANFKKLKFELRFGAYYLKPRIDPNKLANYTFISNHVGKLSIGIRLFYSIFTTGNQLKSPYLLE